MSWPARLFFQHPSSFALRIPFVIDWSLGVRHWSFLRPKTQPAPGMFASPHSSFIPPPSSFSSYTSSALSSTQ